MKRRNRIIIAAVMLAVSFLIKDETAKDILHIAAYIVVGFDVLKKAVLNLRNKDFLDEFFLMSIATLGAIFLKEYFEAAEVMLFYQVGELFQDYAAGRSRDSIEKLLEEVNAPAHVLVGESIEEVDPDDVEVGSLIVVKPGEKVPIDGVIERGSSSVNTANLTGESMPRFLSEGDEILSGMVNLEGALTIKTTKAFEDSAMMKILELIEDASAQKSKTERFITRFARVYTPFVVGIAALVAIIPTVFSIMPFKEALGRSLMMLVVSCPCALLVAVPLSFFGVIGAMSKRGILVKGGVSIERLARMDQAVFDKTGTLTQGTFKVIAVHPRKYGEDMLLKIAAHGESLSGHPIAQSIIAAYNGGIKPEEIENHHEIAGFGIIAKIFKKEVAIGNRRLMEHLNIPWESCHLEGTVVHIAIDGEYEGHIIIADEVKPEARETIAKLKDIGVKGLYMLTGDLEHTANAVAGELALTDYRAELLPEDKVKAFEELKLKSKKPTAYLGDGLNDAPVIAAADLSIAMGLSGAGVAMEEADILLTDDKLSGLPSAIREARRAMIIIYENIAVPIAFKVMVLVLATLGIANMQLAIFADVGILILAVLNATRTMKQKS